MKLTSCQTVVGHVVCGVGVRLESQGLDGKWMEEGVEGGNIAGAAATSAFLGVRFLEEVQSLTLWG